MGSVYTGGAASKHFKASWRRMAWSVYDGGGFEQEVGEGRLSGQEVGSRGFGNQAEQGRFASVKSVGETADVTADTGT